jgi:RimJ/RimL family protein N-acetyltransferase
MILEQFGIKLTRLTRDDIELVRYWRNQPEIRKQMGFQKTITAAMQEKWFKSINNSLNYYLLIHWKEKKIGLINVKNVHVKEKYAEGGIFIWDEACRNSIIPALASLIVLEFTFMNLELNNKSYIHILKSNLRSISYNKRLGYTLVPGQEKNKNQLYLLTKEDYLMKREKLLKGASLVSDQSELRLTIVPSELNLPEINALV